MKKILLFALILALLTIFALILAGKYVKRKNAPTFSNQKLSPITITDNAGTTIKAGSFEAVVEAWSPNDSTIAIKLPNQKQPVFLSFSPNARVIIPPAGKTKAMEGFTVTPKSPRWAVAFCKDDTAIFVIDDFQKVVWANNTGSRICGIGKDE